MLFANLTKTFHHHQKHLISALVVVLLTAMGLQMALAAQADSATADEQIHILSGYATLTQHHILFDPDHPFLAKTLAAIPLLFVRPTLPPAATHLSSDQIKVANNTYKEANTWGYQFLFTQGNNPYQLLNLARGAIIALTLLLGLLIFLWTQQNLGAPAALAALTFYAFDPTFITHGHLANDDTVAALFFVASLMALQHYLIKPTLKKLLLTGVVLGLGLITKFSLLALGPIFILIYLGWHYTYEPTNSENSSVQRQTSHSSLSDEAVRPQSRMASVKKKIATIFTSRARPKQRRKIMLHAPVLSNVEGLRLLSIFLTAYAVIWLTYGGLAVLNPSQNPLFVNYQTIYNAVSAYKHLPPASSLTGQVLNLTGHILPVMWTKGFALVSPVAAGQSRESYLLGQCFRGSRWDYFPVLIFFKMPLPILILLVTSLAALALSIIRRFKRTSRQVDESTDILLPTRFSLSAPVLSDCSPERQPKEVEKSRFLLLFLLLPTVIYLFISSFSGIDIGIRHVLPVYTLLLILAAWPVSWLSQLNAKSSKRPHLDIFTFHAPVLSKVEGSRFTLAVLFFWLILGAIRTYPNYLPYYNELAGEPRSIPYISNDSNIDWGQATKQLDTYIQTHRIAHLAFDNFIGYGEAQYRHIPFTIAQPQDHSYKGYLAISRSTIIDHLCSKNNDWGWVTDHYQPIAIIGNAINLYQIK